MEKQDGTGGRQNQMALSIGEVWGCWSAAIGPVYAQQFPTVANLKPFSAETNFMSLPGYLRWLVFTQTSQWITRDEAVRIVNEQQSLAGR